MLVSRLIMRTIRYTQKNYASELKKLDRRSAPPEGVEETVVNVIAAVQERGDRALIEFGKKFDGVQFRAGKDLRVGAEELAGARESVELSTKRAIAASRKNVIRFAERSLRKDWTAKNAQGALVGEIYQPFERVGIYVPGGSAPLVSTVNMTVCLAKAAGCPEIVVMTPPGRDGKVNPALLFALEEAGATEIYKVGGSPGCRGDGTGNGDGSPGGKGLRTGQFFCRRGQAAVVWCGGGGFTSRSQ